MTRTLATLAAALVAALFATVPAAATTEHCPDHQGHPGKVEAPSNGRILDAGAQFCVKGSTDATGLLVADGVTTLGAYLGTGHDVSYVVIYSHPEPSPTPTTSPTPTVTPTPTPTVTPTVTPTPTPTVPPPHPQPTPTPTPTFQPPDPTEEGVSTPTPTPTTPTPSPTPTPDLEYDCLLNNANPAAWNPDTGTCDPDATGDTPAPTVIDPPARQIAATGPTGLGPLGAAAAALLTFGAAATAAARRRY